LLTLGSALADSEALSVGEVIASDFRGWRGAARVVAVTNGNHCKALAVHQSRGCRAKGAGSPFASQTNVI
jgi:hypothetical protein